MEAFVNEYVIKGEEVLVIKKILMRKNTQIAKENGYFFYFYKEYCLNRKLDLVSYNEFTKLLVEAAEKKGLSCIKTRRRGGNYISGIVLDPIIFTAEYVTG